MGISSQTLGDRSSRKEVENFELRQLNITVLPL